LFFAAAQSDGKHKMPKIIDFNDEENQTVQSLAHANVESFGTSIQHNVKRPTLRTNTPLPRVLCVRSQHRLAC
jgi:hypothetical protein